jgi:hypothetical protein
MVSKYGTAVYRSVRTVVWEVETGNNPVSPTRFVESQSVFLSVSSNILFAFRRNAPLAVYSLKRRSLQTNVVKLSRKKL